MQINWEKPSAEWPKENCDIMFVTRRRGGVIDFGTFEDGWFKDNNGYQWADDTVLCWAYAPMLPDWALDEMDEEN